MENLVAKAKTKIKAPISKVWDALINPKMIKDYMFGTNVVSEWTEGSRIQWKGEWQGKTYEDKGTILQIKPNERLQYTHFSPMMGKPDAPENYHTVTIDLRKEENETLLTLSQDNNATEQDKEHSEKNWKNDVGIIKKAIGKLTSLRNQYEFESPFKSDPLSLKAFRYLNNCKQLLDVGCGEGADSVYFAKKGFQVTAIDNNKTYLDRLLAYSRDKGLTNISINCDDIIDFPYRQNYYDAILCLLVGCCMKRSEFERLHSVLKRTVKKSGIIIMSLRNYLDEEFAEYVSKEKMIEPNTFIKNDDCCNIRYFIEKNRLREVFSDFEILHYYEGYAPDKYKEVPKHGDSYIICRKRLL